MTIRVADRAASEAFYNTVLEPLGIETTYSDARFAEWDDFSVTATRRRRTRSRAGCTSPSARGRASSSRRSGGPARRRATAMTARLGRGPQYRDDYYGGFLLDPDGNSVEAVHHADIRPPGHIDHLWIRVADVPAAAAFYAARRALRRLPAQEQRARSRPLRRRRRLVLPRGRHADREPPRGLPGRRERRAVDAFHRAAMEAGYRDNGAARRAPPLPPRLLRGLRARPRRRTTSRSSTTTASRFCGRRTPVRAPPGAPPPVG